MAFVLTADQKIRVRADVVDAAGNPIVTGTPPTFTSSNPAILRIVAVLDDAFAVYAEAVGPAGTATVRADVTGTDLSDTAEFEVVAGAPARLALTVGTAEPK